jgi:hypothetical protein
VLYRVRHREMLKQYCRHSHKLAQITWSAAPAAGSRGTAEGVKSVNDGGAACQFRKISWSP